MRWQTIVAIWLGLATNAAAQDSLATPEAAVNHLFATMRAGNWSAFAASMHPTALRKFHDMLGPVVVSPRGAEVRRELFGGATAEDISKFSDEQFFARFISKSMGADPELRTVLDSSQIQVLGHVDEAPDVAHVLVRMRMSIGGIRIAKPDVISFERQGSVWLGLLRADVEIMAAALRQRFGT
jgi:hypothetical protein